MITFATPDNDINAQIARHGILGVVARRAEASIGLKLQGCAERRPHFRFFDAQVSVEWAPAADNLRCVGASSIA